MHQRARLEAAPGLAEGLLDTPFGLRRQQRRSRKCSNPVKLHDAMLAFAVARRSPGIFSNSLEPGFDAALVEQQHSRDHILGHAFSGGPAQPIRSKIETEAVQIR
jgi:hypothetical protein